MNKTALLWTLVFGVSLCMNPSWGDVKVWDGTDGAWTAAGSWNPAGVPAATDSATVAGGNVTFNLTDNVTAQTLAVGGGTGAAKVTYTTSDSATPFAGISRFVIRQNGTLTGNDIGVNGKNDAAHTASGNWLISGGALAATGRFYFGNADVTVENGGSITATELRIASIGTGSLTQTSGTVLAYQWLTVGEGVATADGTYNLLGGTLTSNGNAFVLGVNGKGTFNMSGGTAYFNGTNGGNSMVLGWLAGGKGIANVSGGTLNIKNALDIRYNADTIFNQTGGTVSVGTALKITAGSYNLSGGTFAAPTAITAGENGFVMSGGTFTPAGLGTVGTTTFTGNFAPTGGEFVFDVTKDKADSLVISGTSGITENQVKVRISDDTAYGTFTKDYTLVTAGGAAAITKSITSTEHTWTAGATGNWADAQWTSGGTGAIAPTGGAFDTYTINKGTVNTVAADVLTGNRLTVGDGTSTNNNTAKLVINATAGSNPFSNMDYVTVKKGGTIQFTADVGNKNGTNCLTGDVTLDGGTITTGKYLYMGTAQLTMESGNITANEFRVGNSGTTGWMVQNGGTVSTVSWLTIAESGDYGKYTVNGGTVSVGGNMAVAVNAHKGELEINGGSVSVGDTAFIGYQDTSTGTLALNEGTFTAGTIIIRKLSDLTQTGGTLVTANLQQLNGGKYDFLGGTLTSKDAATTTTITGNLTMAEGADYRLHANGTASNKLAVGGTATLNGLFTLDGTAQEGTTYTIATAGAFDFGEKTFDQWAALMPTFTIQNTGTALTMQVAAGDLYWNDDRAADGLWATGSNWDVKKGGNLIQAANTPLNIDNVFIENGFATADALAAKNLTVGGAGAGTLKITASGNPFANLGNVTVNAGGTIQFAANVNDLSGSILLDGGTIQASNLLYMGTAQLTMESGNITANQFRVGNSGTTGWMVQNGGTVTSTHWLTIGEEGSGKYTLNDGTVNGPSVAIGVAANQTGELEMNGGTFNVNGKIEWKGQPTAGMILGFRASDTATSSKGILKVNDGTLNAANGIALVNPSEMTIDGGTVNITDAAAALNIGAGSAVTLSDGTLSTPTLVKDAAGTFDFTGGTLDVDTADFKVEQKGGSVAPGGKGVVGKSVFQALLSTAGDWNLDLDADEIDNITITGDEFSIAGMDSITLSPLGTPDFTDSDPLEFLTFTGDKVEGLAGALQALLTGDLANSLFVLDTATGYALTAENPGLPEPSTWLLLALGGLYVLRLAKKGRKS